jgi:hypothetical protein
MATEDKLTWSQIEAKIKEESGIEFNELPRRQAHVWVPKRTPTEVQIMLALMTASPQWSTWNDAQKAAKLDDLMSEMTPMTIMKNMAWPPNPAYVVAELFDDEDEVRVYAIAGKDRESGISFGMRYTISKSCPLPVYTASGMFLDVWVAALTEEWSAVDGETNLAEVATEEERDAVIAYLKSVPADYQIKDAIDDIEEELHLIDPDDDDDGDEPEETETKAAAEVARGSDEPVATAPGANGPAGLSEPAASAT